MFFSDGSVLTGLCTTSQLLLEFVDDKLVQHVVLGNVPEQIFIFTSYDPLQKYFIVLFENNTVLVYKRCIPLVVSTTKLFLLR